MSKPLRNLPATILALAGVVAANTNLTKQWEALKPGRPYIFFSAKTAAIFMQLSNGLHKWPASPQH